MNRETEALQMANKDGRNWEDLNEVMRNAYLHNADTAAADRKAQAEVKAEAQAPSGSVTCPVCKGERWLGDKPCHECNPVGLPQKTEDSELEPEEKVRDFTTDNELAKEVPKEKPAEKPREPKPGEYFCTKCQSPHRRTSKKGKKHSGYESQG